MSAVHPLPEPVRLRLRVRGAVQGVGFRPHVYGLARRMTLGGFVLNDGQGVLLEVEGRRAAEFAEALPAGAPRLARIDAIEVEQLACRGEEAVANLASAGGASATCIPPDAAVCDDCRADLRDPGSRFHGYPFVSCTHCGPRFTLTRQLPYDRPQTSMAGFPLCEPCARDYADPTNRRFHAQPIACPACGPQLSHEPAAIAAALRDGRIVALKGIGGFHLMCDARNEAAVAGLRRRKVRDAKPFAVMVADLAAARRIGEIGETEVALLASPAAPVVLLKRRDDLAPSIAPRLDSIGVMLPYAPLHHLIFDAAGPDLVLVATSANPGGEPLVIDDADAERRLGGIADLVVTHDRPIVIRADDSVLRVIDGAPAFLRRARGYVPDPVALPEDGPTVLALGGHLKVAVTLTRGRDAFVSQHVGSLDNAETIRFLGETIRHLLRLVGVAPAALACDLHPDFATSRLAQDLGEEFGVPVLPIQHHAAHAAALAAEHGVTGQLLAAVLDGHGAGPNGEAWGGELLKVEGGACARLGHLAPLALPGGDRAAREPWRMALAALDRLGQLGEAARRFPGVPQATALADLLRRRPPATTTSAGRLFDAAAGLLGTCLEQAYEGQAAMELEALVRHPRAIQNGWTLANGVLDLLPLLAALADPACEAQNGSELFHGTFAAGLVAWIAEAAPAGAPVGLGGGCFANRVLAEAVAEGLRARGLLPLLPRAVPAGDGGLSLGQALLARRSLEV
ncbi:MAG: carbamoyltransferase HypF [Alsobacter sp.]